MFEAVLNIFNNTENLLIALPIMMIVISVIVILISYTRPSTKVKSTEIKEETKKKSVEKINFREELDRIAKDGDYNKGTKKLCLLANKFLSQLFEINHAFTYEEIKKEANNYGFKKIINLCDMLSILNFAKDNYSEQDFKNLTENFSSILDSYGNIISEGSQISKLDEPNNTKSAFSRLKDFILVRKSTITQLEKYLKSNHPDLFKNDGINYKEEAEKIGGDNSKLVYLTRIGHRKINENKLQSANSIYETIKELSAKVSPKDKELLKNQIEGFHKSLLNLMGIKAAEEIIWKIREAVSQDKHKEAKKLFNKLKYIYYRTSFQSSIEIYKKWTSSINKETPKIY